MRNLHRALLALAVVAAFAPAALAGPKAVVELFTSQGCSSCPPADAFLADLAERDDVIALSLHVDYWDYLGWKDTFGQPENTARQYSYSKVRGDGKVYTPQMVLNGTGDYVGSNREAVQEVLKSAKLPVDVSVTRDGGAIKIVVGSANEPAAYHAPEITIRLIVFDPAATVTIQRGENAGRTATYRNVVRSMRPIGMWSGERIKISLPADEILHSEGDGCVVILQEERHEGAGRILGAAQL